MCGDFFGFTAAGGVATGIQLGKAKHSTMHKIIPCFKESSGSNVECAEVDRC
jgi:hypothetical protein